MTTQNDGMDNNQPQEQLSNGPLDRDVSRRQFLRTAVIGTAGIAGAAGVAGIVLSNRGGSRPGLLPALNVGQPGVSSNDPYNFLFENTTQDSDSSAIGKTAPSADNPATLNLNEDYFAVVAIYLSSFGSGSITLQESLDNSTWTTVSSSSSPFDLSSGGGNSVLAYWTSGSVGNGPYAKASSGTQVGAGSSFPTTFTTTGAGVLTVFTHLNYDGTTANGFTPYTVYFQYIITPPSGPAVTIPFQLKVYPDKN